MPTATVNGTAIYYEQSGPEGAPLLVFGNSLGTDLHMWDGQAEALAGQYRILRYDSRGHGRSAAPGGNYTIAMLADDLIGLVDHLGIETFSYCGLSMGGMVGQSIGTHHGDRIRRLILCNTSSHMSPPEAWTARIEAVTSGGMEAVVDAVVDRWFTPGFQASSPAEVMPIREMILTTQPRGYAGCCAAIRDMDQRESIRAITVPTLVIAGGKDPATPIEAAELIAGRIPGARLHVIDNAAHLSNIEGRDEFTRTISAFLE
jgi:3-oxoadipate enol-lactonase